MFFKKCDNCGKRKFWISLSCFNDYYEEYGWGYWCKECVDGPLMEIAKSYTYEIINKERC